MSFLCLPNIEKNRLYNARETFFALVNDIEKSDGKKDSPVSPIKLIKQITADCTEPIASIQLGSTAFISPLHATQYLISLSSPFLLGIERPPAVVA
jgi:hypothetical protein